MNERCAREIGREVIFQTVGEMERGLLGHVLNAFEQRLVAVPANFEAAIKVGLRPRHLEDAFGLERGLGTENIGVRLEAHARATPIGCTTGFFQLPFWLAAFERHPIEPLLRGGPTLTAP